MVMAKAKKVRARKFKVNIEGADEVVKTLEKLGVEAKQVMQDAAMEGGRIALSEARRRVPVDTGRLRRSLRLRKGRKTETKADVKVTHGEKEYYGTFLELGTSNMQARPFLRPAVDENKAQISKAVSKEVSKALGRVK